jgi:hypothetical protein
VVVVDVRLPDGEGAKVIGEGRNPWILDRSDCEEPPRSLRLRIAIRRSIGSHPVEGEGQKAPKGRDECEGVGR